MFFFVGILSFICICVTQSQLPYIYQEIYPPVGPVFIPYGYTQPGSSVMSKLLKVLVAAAAINRVIARNNPPTTPAIDCGTPPTLANGSPSFSSTTFQSIVTYTCKPTYVLYPLKSTGQITCPSSGTWPSLDFMCTAIPT